MIRPSPFAFSELVRLDVLRPPMTRSPRSTPSRRTHFIFWSFVYVRSGHVSVAGRTSPPSSGSVDCSAPAATSSGFLWEQKRLDHRPSSKLVLTRRYTKTLKMGSSLSLSYILSRPEASRPSRSGHCLEGEEGSAWPPNNSNYAIRKTCQCGKLACILLLAMEW
jgi:hypothetical protein